jgi:hypothetical protein
VDESTAVDSNRSVLVRGYETMTDVDTGTGLFPTVTQAANLYWRKSITATTTSRPWRVIADDRFFYFLSSTDSGPIFLAQSFGDIVNHKPGDGYAAFMNGGVSLSSTLCGANLGNFPNPAFIDGHYLARNTSQTGGSIQVSKYNPSRVSSGNAADNYIGRNATSALWPSTVDGSLRAFPTYITEQLAGKYDIRGALPGMFGVTENMSSAGSGDTFDNAINLANHRLVNWIINSSPNTAYTPLYDGSALFDHTGPWR